MIDPASLGTIATKAAGPAARVLSSALTARLQRNNGVSLGSRKERRLVYQDFQMAVADTLAFVQYLRMELKLSGPIIGRARVRQLQLMLKDHTTVLLYAFGELRLVATEEPFRAADDVMTHIDALSKAANGRSERKFDAALDAFGEAQRGFVQACRVDLKYTPRWWQWRRRRAEQARG
ncbi:hypothetical protein ACFWPV_09940 [Streptomyces uncialis]|uniref:hypothetical protein n=1 Tax=Streptomyces uncialis TaxID=1048205 RepID=UPI00365730FE